MQPYYHTRTINLRLKHLKLRRYISRVFRTATYKYAYAATVCGAVHQNWGVIFPAINIQSAYKNGGRPCASTTQKCLQNAHITHYTSRYTYNIHRNDMGLWAETLCEYDSNLVPTAPTLPLPITENSADLYIIIQAPQSNGLSTLSSPEKNCLVALSFYIITGT